MQQRDGGGGEEEEEAMVGERGMREGRSEGGREDEAGQSTLTTRLVLSSPDASHVPPCVLVCLPASLTHSLSLPLFSLFLNTSCSLFLLFSHSESISSSISLSHKSMHFLSLSSWVVLQFLFFLFFLVFFFFFSLFI